MDVLDRLGQSKGRWKTFLDSKKEPVKAPAKSQFLSVTASLSGSNKVAASTSGASAVASSSGGSMAGAKELKDLLGMPLDRIRKYETFLQDIEHTTPPGLL